MNRLATVLAFADERVQPAVRWLPRQGSPTTDRARWTLPALSGRLVELSGLGASATLSLAFSLVADAQGRQEPVAWVACHGSSFFPPDAAACGVDLDNLPVVFTPTAARAARAGERLLRSGAFGLVVLDLAGERPLLPQALISRLAGLAEKHDAVVAVLTAKPAERTSLGSLVSLRAEARRTAFSGGLAQALGRVERQVPGRYACRLEVLKDKRRPPGWTHEEIRLGPPGL
ncbi:MAG: recombinase A [Thermoanaerobaculia bacterium]